MEKLKPSALLGELQNSETTVGKLWRFLTINNTAILSDRNPTWRHGSKQLKAKPSEKWMCVHHVFLFTPHHSQEAEATQPSPHHRIDLQNVGQTSRGTLFGLKKKIQAHAIVGINYETMLGQ